MTAIHYKGSAPANIDIMGGRVDIHFDGIGTSLPQRRQQEGQGDRRHVGHAHGGRARRPDLRRVRACRGWSRTRGTASWRPPGTPQAIVDKLNSEIVALGAREGRHGAAWQGRLGDQLDDARAVREDDRRRNRDVAQDHRADEPQDGVLVHDDAKGHDARRHRGRRHVHGPHRARRRRGARHQGAERAAQPGGRRVRGARGGRHSARRASPTSCTGRRWRPTRCSSARAA